MKTFQIDTNQVVKVDVSHIDCMGNCSVYVKLQDGTEFDIHRISYRKVDQLEYNLTHPDLVITFDSSLLEESEEQWLASNGIKAV